MFPSATEVSHFRVSEENKTFRVEYFLTEGLCASDGAESLPAYGVRATLRMDGKQADDSPLDGNPLDCAQVDDISVSKEEVLGFIRLLARGAVTPVCLKDAAEDFIAAK